ncbi:hypothetical protein N9045_01845 [bacterium]|nr:hypothetical protein [bacterium]
MPVSFNSYSTKQEISNVRLVALKGALKMEVAGMKKRGRSAYAIVKEEFGFKGSKQKVLEQLEAHLKALAMQEK